MEKFNTWADSFTGVQPFLPLPSLAHSLSGFQKLLYWIKWLVVSPILALFKLPFVLLTLALLVLLDSLGQFIPVPLLRRGFLRTIHFIFGGSLLVMIGLLWDSKYVPSKRGNSKPTQACGSYFKSGDLIVANHTSYVELIYLLFKFSPQFTSAPNTWSGDNVPEGIVIPVSFFRALLDTIYQPLYSVDKAIPLQNVILETIKQQKGPIVLFPEATTTNGKVLLGCVPLLPMQFDLQKNLHIHVVGFKYEYFDFSPVYTAGSFFSSFILALWTV